MRRYQIRKGSKLDRRIQTTMDQTVEDFSRFATPETLQAWQELQSVPSYVERFQRIKNMTDAELSTRIAQLNQDCPDLN